jgi:hypothetical protein
MLRTRFPLPRQDLWLRKKGMGKKQPVMVGSTMLGIGGIVMITSIILTLLVSPVFIILSSTLGFISIVIGGVFLSSLIRKDHYHHYGMVILGDGKVPFRETRRFIEEFLEDRDIPYERKAKGVNEFKWWFGGGHEGHVFVISSQKWAFALGIKDQDGSHEKLVDDFARGFSQEFSIPYEEKWSKGWLD